MSGSNPSLCVMLARGCVVYMCVILTYLAITYTFPEDFPSNFMNSLTPKQREILKDSAMRRMWLVISLYCSYIIFVYYVMKPFENCNPQMLMAAGGAITPVVGTLI